MRIVNVKWRKEGLPKTMEIPFELRFAFKEELIKYVHFKTNHEPLDFVIERMYFDCGNLIREAIKLKLLKTQNDKIFVYKEKYGWDMIDFSEAVKDLQDNVEAQELFIKEIRKLRDL